MMKRNFFKTVVLATMCVALLGLASCSSDSDHKEDTISSSVVQGTISDTYTLDASIVYTLEGTVVVAEGGDLVIPAGTTIKAKPGFSNYLIVLQGGQIHANGTATNPVVFTCQSETPGAWGGIVINGYAPISGAETSNNIGSTEVATEYPYGGSNEADNSGRLKYVKILYSGANNGDEVEHNGLTLNGVGNGTTIDQIFIKDGNDDAVEFFGGCVNVSNIVSVDSDDDMFDFTQGYCGTVSNAYGVWTSTHSSTEGDPRGVEADGNLDGSNPSAYHQSDFKIENLTVAIYSNSTEEGRYMHDGIKIRRGAIARITNALFIGSGQVKDLVDCTDKKGGANASTSIAVTNALTTALTGVEVNVDETQAPTVTVESGHTGADQSAFSWTGYAF